MTQEIRTFGPFSLDLARHQLLRDNLRVNIQPQPLSLLILLTDQPGDTVTHKAIEDALWKGTVTVDFEQAIRFAIRQVRIALGDSGEDPVYIETVPKRGYRFIGTIHAIQKPVSQPAPELPPAPPAGIAPAPPAQTAALQPSLSTAGQSSAQPDMMLTEALTLPVRSVHRRIWIGAALATVAACLLLWYFHISHTFAARGPVPSIVVLPIANLTGDLSKEYLADGTTDEIIAQLAMMAGPHLRVIARSTSMFYKHKDVKPGEVGTELHVGYVLEGSIVGQGDGLRIHTRLIRTGDESQVFARIFDTDAKQMPVSASILATDVLTALPLGLPHFDTPSTYISPSREARDGYIRGEHFLWLRTHEGLTSALFEFKSVVAADPSYAQAFSQLAITYLQMGGYGWMDQKQAAEMGRQAIETSLRLDPTLADAHAARGFYRWFYQWDWTGGEDDFMQAIQRDPSNVNALHWYALALTTAGRNKEGEQWMRRALEIDPKSEIVQTNLGWIEYLGGDPQQSAETLEAVLRNDPGFLSARLKLWAVYSLQNRNDNAFHQLQLLSLASLTPDAQQALDSTLRTHGYPAALQLWSRSWDNIGYGSALIDAEIAAFRGDRESVIRILLEGYRTHDGWMVFTPTDPALRTFRSDPRLKQLNRELLTH